MFCSTASKPCSVFGAHEEVELADRQQEPVVHVRPARHDGHIESVFPVSAVGQRLIVAAVLGLRQPVGAERHLVERLRGCAVAPAQTRPTATANATRFNKATIMITSQRNKRRFT